MSDCIESIAFSKNTLRLDMIFEDDDYEKATVKFKLVSKNNVIEESLAIPVKLIFDVSFLIGMCVRRTAVQYEKEIQEMQDVIAMKKHPFKHIGGSDGKED